MIRKMKKSVLARSIRTRREDQQADEVDDHPDRVLLARARQPACSRRTPSSRGDGDARPAVSQAIRDRVGRPGERRGPSEIARTSSRLAGTSRPAVVPSLEARSGGVRRARIASRRRRDALTPSGTAGRPAAPATTVIDGHDRRAGASCGDVPEPGVQQRPGRRAACSRRSGPGSRAAAVAAGIPRPGTSRAKNIGIATARWRRRVVGATAATSRPEREQRPPCRAGTPRRSRAGRFGSGTSEATRLPTTISRTEADDRRRPC